MIWLPLVRTKTGSFPKWGDMANTTQYKTARLNFEGQLEPQEFSECRFRPYACCLAHSTGMSLLNYDASLPSCSISHTQAAFIGVKLNLRLKGEHDCMVMNYVDSLHKEKPPMGL